MLEVCDMKLKVIMVNRLKVFIEKVDSTCD